MAKWFVLPLGAEPPDDDFDVRRHRAGAECHRRDRVGDVRGIEPRREGWNGAQARDGVAERQTVEESAGARTYVRAVVARHRREEPSATEPALCSSGPLDPNGGCEAAGPSSMPRLEPRCGARVCTARDPCQPPGLACRGSAAGSRSRCSVAPSPGSPRPPQHQSGPQRRLVEPRPEPTMFDPST